MDQNTKQHNVFILSVAGPSIDTTVVTIEEMQKYSEQRKRIAIVVTEKKSYGELDRMNYTLVMNYTKPKVFAVNTKNRPYLEVYNFLLERFHGGLIIAETDTLSDPVIELITKSDKMAVNDIDIMICHNGLEELVAREIDRANLMRIHAVPDLNVMIFQNLAEFFQQAHLGVMLSQLFTNDQYEEVKEYFDRNNSRYAEKGMKDYIDYYEMNKQFSYFVYMDIKACKLLNVSKDVLFEFMTKLKKLGMFPLPEDQLPVIAENLTIS
jgi:hypothetical protein